MAGPRFALRAAAPHLAVLLAYALAMAYVEAAAVLYLRTIYGAVDPTAFRSTPFNPVPDFDAIEVGREAATIVMLGTVGWLAGRGTGGRLGAFVAAFGVWDIFYYVFLWLFTGWPSSVWAPDVLFLIPLPWWGPVLSPALAAVVMVVAGAAALARDFGDGVPPMDRTTLVLLVVGTVVCLVAFMADALQALPRGLDAALSVRNGPFPWPLYGLGLLLAASGAGRLVIRKQRL